MLEAKSLEVVRLASKEAMCEENSGGKGASLAQMISIKSQLNAKIPRGIVLTTKAYESHLESNQSLKKVIDNLLEVSNKLCSEMDTEKRLYMKTELENHCERYLFFSCKSLFRLSRLSVHLSVRSEFVRHNFFST